MRRIEYSRIAWNVVVVCAMFAAAWMLGPRVMLSIENAMRHSHREITGAACEGGGYLLTCLTVLATLLSIFNGRVGAVRRVVLAIAALGTVGLLVASMTMMGEGLLRHFWREPATAIAVVLVTTAPVVLCGRGNLTMLRDVMRRFGSRRADR